MIWRITSVAVLLSILSATPATAQYGRFRARGFSFRSPMMDIDVSPMGGLQMRGPAMMPPLPPSPFGYPPLPPMPSLRMSPRGYSAGRVEVRVPALPSGRYPGALTNPLQPLVPAPSVAPPQYDVPSYAEVFPESSQPSMEPTAASETIVDLLTAVSRLDADLSRREDAEVWSDYLQLDSVQAMARSLVGERRLDALADDVAVHRQATELVIPFDAVTASRDLGWLASLDSFQGTRQALRKLAGPDAHTAAGPAGDAVRVPRSVLERQAPPVTPKPSESEGLEELPAPLPDPQSNQAKPVYRGEA